MKTICITASLFLTLTAVSCAGTQSESTDGDFAQYVDPFIGTGDHGHVFLGANVPFGMVQLGPSQRVKGWDWCSGYHYSDTTLLGFSHTHLSGTGIGDLGDLLMLPVINQTDTMATFSHLRETCTPGYYKVTLDDDIIAELTATPRTGMHRYSFPAGADTVFVRVDLGYGIGWDRPVETSLTLDNDSTISGYRYSSGWAKDQKIYFTAQFSKPIAGCDIDSTAAGSLATLGFINDEAPLLVKVGLSPVSIDNAVANLLYENSDSDFDFVAREAREAWNSELSKINVETSNPSDRHKFYTALYHTMFAPATFSDVNGDFRGADGKVYNTGGEFTNYTIFSLWDTYRAAHPLSTVIHPDIQSDYAGTFLEIYRRQGKLPVWHLHGNETDCMIGNPGVIVLGDLLLKGFVTDTLAAYEAMKASCMLDERSLDALKKYGYIPYDIDGGEENVAKGLEYAIADNAVAKVAAELGYDDDAVYFAQRAKSYGNYFDQATGFMRGKSISGTFRDEVFNPFATTHRADDYCEGNGWQYAWLVPHDPHGLISLFGSEERFVAKLDSLFTVEGCLGDEASPDISGLIGQYAHGNEPGHHTVYLYSYAGKPWKAAPLLRHIMNDLYNDDMAGLCGNEDVGQMSAWYVLSSMGLYQVEPTGGKFVIGSPVFDKVSVNVGGGKTFEIIARNNSGENIYVQSVMLNGQPYDKTYVDYRDIMSGGQLELTMGPEPSTTYGVNSDARP
ncbi:MAG: GH92 family glycosyl hydrolase [Muribaculaceae bacterium]|nr:GH92 family glycosyl hydrolase [Muribaculaceae bacterium]